MTAVLQAVLLSCVGIGCEVVGGFEELSLKAAGLEE
jgi:hypothetical protein